MKRGIGLMAAVLVGAAGCAFPLGGGDEGDPSYSGIGGGTMGTSTSSDGTTGGGPVDVSNADPGPLGLLAYQAIGEHEGKTITVSRAAVDFGHGDVVQMGDCYGVRTDPDAPVGVQMDAGDLSIVGGNQPYSCRFANGRYQCDVPAESGFFTAGATLGMRIVGNGPVPAQTMSGIVPPRAPKPDVALDRIFSATEPVTVSWQPSEEPADMTCLNLESFDASGRRTGFVQCDVNDSDGQTTVPVEMLQMLDPQAKTLRATLYSANAGGTVDAWAAFGNGTFVEVQR